MRETFTWQLPRTAIELGRRTLIMGILNVTPDSFSDGGKYMDPKVALDRGLEIESEGAGVLDIGGESTRPGSIPIPQEEELRRVIPTVKALARELEIPISVDTYRSEIARQAIDAGAQIINDISGLEMDPKMRVVASETKTGVVLMHSRGARRNIHDRRTTDDLEKVCEELGQSIETAVNAGIDRGAVVADPGVGFGKSPRNNLKVLKRLDIFSRLGYPLLVGVSRKYLIKGSIPASSATVWTTAAAVALAVRGGAHAVRVHQIPEMRAVAEMVDQIEQA
jgi:dihydropteroate synthase